LHHI
jgi:hypothetical protein